MTSFSAQVDAFVRKTKERTEAVFKDSVQTLIEEMQTPVAKGGRMRVDTGFLRATGQASLSGLPSGASSREEGLPSYDAAAVISNAKVGDMISFGWTANYARYRNYTDGFMTEPLMRWQQIVNESAARAKASIK